IAQPLNRRAQTEAKTKSKTHGLVGDDAFLSCRPGTGSPMGLPNRLTGTKIGQERDCPSLSEWVIEAGYLRPCPRRKSEFMRYLKGIGRSGAHILPWRKTRDLLRSHHRGRAACSDAVQAHSPGRARARRSLPRLARRRPRARPL